MDTVLNVSLIGENNYIHIFLSCSVIYIHEKGYLVDFTSTHAILTPVLSIFGRFFIQDKFSPVTPCDDIDIKRCEVFLRIF